MSDILALDVSNYDGDINSLLDRHPEIQRVVVRCSLERDALMAITRSQCETVLARGLGLDTYCWAYPTLDDPDTLASRAQALSGPYRPDYYWIDCEDTGNSYPDSASNVAWLMRAVAGFQALGLRVGIYTGHWFWTSAQMGNPTDFAALPLWSATDTKVPDRAQGWAYGGWAPPFAGVQYDLSGPDRDCFDAALYAENGGDNDMTDSQRAIVQDEILRNVNKALSYKGLPAGARTALESGAKPACETLIRGEG